MIENPYMWLKALHVIAVISWMAGLLYLPRLYYYHTQVAVGSEASELFKTMERRLLRIIINPAMIAVFVFGAGLVYYRWPDIMKEGWFHAKVLLVLVMAGLHGMMAKYRKNFAADKNTKSAKFYRLFNEAPAVAMIIIVLLVILKPF